jgi:replicative DNA helicase
MTVALSAITNSTPANLEAEQSLIGIALYNNDALRKIDGVTPDSFHEPYHGRIWGCIQARAARQQLSDPALLVKDLEHDPAFAAMGGVAYLADLFDRAPPTSSVTDYAATVCDLAARRSLIAIARDLAETARSPADTYETITQAETRLRDVARGSEPGDANLVDARAAADALMDDLDSEAEHGRPKGLMTGLRCVDRRLLGLRPGHLVIIAGRPSMGKTALARQIAYGCAARNPKHQVAFFCLEMARREITERALSELTYRDGSDGFDQSRRRIPYQDMSGEKLSQADRMRLRDLSWKIPKNLILDDTASLSVEYVRRRVWALNRKAPVGAVFIDYLQIMQRPDGKGRNDASVIGEMTSALKRLAREAGCAIVLLSQINRGVESRDDKRPQLSDLRESGSIEQDANAVLFPYREVYYLERAEPKQESKERAKWENDVEVHRRQMIVACAKNRQGSIGSDEQEYWAEFDAISDIREAGR